MRAARFIRHRVSPMRCTNSRFQALHQIVLQGIHETGILFRVFPQGGQSPVLRLGIESVTQIGRRGASLALGRHRAMRLGAVGAVRSQVLFRHFLFVN